MSKTINDGGPAFPVPVERPFGEGLCAIGGLSIRAYFAGQALAGMCAAKWHPVHRDGSIDIEGQAEMCVKQADALIARLEKP